jgi:hypothetical protein
VRFDVLTVVGMKVTAVWDIAPCSLAEVDVSEVYTAFIIRAILFIMGMISP